MEEVVKKPTSLSDFVVSDTHIIYFIDGTTAATQFTNQNKTDVIESTLLAQLTSVDDANSVEKADDWVSRYTDIAAATAGWLLQSGANFKTAGDGFVSVSIDITAVKALRQALDISIDAIIGLLQALLYLAGKSSARDILESNGKTDCSGGFQLIFCKKTSKNDITFHMMPFVFETTETVVSCVFQPVEKASTYKFKYMAVPTVLALNLEKYADVRQEIHDKLVGYVDDLVAYMDI